MRQIDDMTPQEIDTLHLKGMLRLPTRKELSEKLHNALLWQERTQAHADKLAEALRIAKNAFTHSADGVIRFSDSERCQIREALAAWSKANE
jgi:hypothetical protein